MKARGHWSATRAVAEAATIGALAVSLLLGCATEKRVGAPVSSASLGAEAVEPAVPPSPPTMRLLSQSQYAHTIEDIFGADITAKSRFAPVNRINGLVAVGASRAVVTAGVLDPLDATGRAISQQVMDPKHRGMFVPCQPAAVAARDDACARQFLSAVGRRLYRRPLTQTELSAAVEHAGQGALRSGDFYTGLSFALNGMLVSPHFLYIAETTEPDRSGGRRLDGYSKAARLSFLLWDSAPDEGLLRAAERGDLHSKAGLRREVTRMLDSPKFERGVRAFFTDYFILEAFDGLAKDSVIYPAYTLQVAQDSREQVLRMAVDHLVARRGDYRDLFTTKHTILTANLAAIYRMPLDIPPEAWRPHDFAPNDPRGGLLTTVGFLSQHAHPGRSSATRRGRALREILLCQSVPDPPPTVDFTAFEDPNAPNRTARERLSAHATVPVCRGCHAMTDPIGLGLENFDGAGQLRQTERGALIDPKGVLDGVTFSDPSGLGRALRDNPALRSCVVSRLYAYGVGRPLAPNETPLLRYFKTELDQSGYRFDDMLRLMIFSKAFFAIKPAEGGAMIAEQTSREGKIHAR